MHDKIDILLDQLAIVLDRLHQRDGDRHELMKAQARILAQIEAQKLMRTPAFENTGCYAQVRAGRHWLN